MNHSYPKTKFADSNDIMTQIEHILEEADELRKAYARWQNAPGGLMKSEFDRMMCEAVDLDHSIDTLSRIAETEFEIAVNEVVGKNTAKKYYTHTFGGVAILQPMKEEAMIIGKQVPIMDKPMPPEEISSEFGDALINVLDEVGTFLVEKNKSYGDSARNPVRIFAKAAPLEQINVRIDDKLSRLMNGNEYPGDDDELDLLGYLILKRVVKAQNK